MTNRHPSRGAKGQTVPIPTLEHHLCRRRCCRRVTNNFWRRFMGGFYLEQTRNKTTCVSTAEWTNPRTRQNNLEIAENEIHSWDYLIGGTARTHASSLSAANYSLHGDAKGRRHFSQVATLLFMEGAENPRIVILTSSSFYCYCFAGCFDSPLLMRTQQSCFLSFRANCILRTRLRRRGLSPLMLVFFLVLFWRRISTFIFDEFCFARRSLLFRTMSQSDPCWFYFREHNLSGFIISEYVVV